MSKAWSIFVAIACLGAGPLRYRASARRVDRVPVRPELTTRMRDCGARSAMGGMEREDRPGNPGKHGAELTFVLSRAGRAPRAPRATAERPAGSGLAAFPPVADAAAGGHTLWSDAARCRRLHCVAGRPGDGAQRSLQAACSSMCTPLRRRSRQPSRRISTTFPWAAERGWPRSRSRRCRPHSRVSSAQLRVLRIRRCGHSLMAWEDRNQRRRSPGHSPGLLLLPQPIT